MSMAGMIEKDEMPVCYSTKKAHLCIIVDTEEEFDWNIFSSDARSVTNIRNQELLQRVYEKYGIVPTYAVDYAVASQEAGYRPLREFLTDGVCEVGAHLHPWLNPPIREDINVRNSYPCNLCPDLEYQKIQQLTRLICDKFEIQPALYKAGRYGVGRKTISSLQALGYSIDCSVLPGTDLRPQEGPNFNDFSSGPYWIAGSSIMEIPITTGFPGILEHHRATIYPRLRGRVGEQMRLPGIFARLRLLDRIRLTPEGVSLSEAKRLTRHLVNDKKFSLLTLTYHSSSLGVANTPYVRDRVALEKFIAWIRDYLDFFFGEIGGAATTARRIHLHAASRRHQHSEILPGLGRGGIWPSGSSPRFGPSSISKDARITDGADPWR